MQAFKVGTLLAFFLVFVSARGSKLRDGPITVRKSPESQKVCDSTGINCHRQGYGL